MNSKLILQDGDVMFKQLNKPLALLSLSHMITDLSQGCLPVLLPFFKSAFGLTYVQIGIIVMAQSITSSVIQPIFGYISDRLSLSWLVPVSVLVAGTGMAITGLVTSYHLLLIIVIVSGLGVAAFHPQASKGAHFVSNQSHKGKGMAIFSMGGNLGHAGGALFMTILLTMPGALNNTVYFAIPAVILTLLLWRNLPQISPQSQSNFTESISKAKSKIPFLQLSILLIFIFFRSSVSSGLTTYIPLYYVNHLSGSPLYASYILSAFMLSGIAGTYVGGTISDRVGRKIVIIGSMFFLWPQLVLFQYTTGIATVLLSAVIGFTLVASFVATLVLSQEMMPGYEAMAGGLTMGFSIGLAGVGTTLLGYIADYSGIPSVFTVISWLPLAGLVFAAFLPGQLIHKNNIRSL